MDIDTVFNVRAVDEALVTSGSLNEAQLSALARQGFRRVINLLPPDNPHAVAAEPDIVRAQGLAYDNIPVDFSAPTLDDFVRFADLMDQRGAGRTLVHCAANYRVSAFMAAYGIMRLGWSRERAEQWIGDIWNPAQHPPWPGLIDALFDHASRAGSAP